MLKTKAAGTPKDTDLSNYRYRAQPDWFADEFLTDHQLAALLKVCVHSVTRYRRLGKLPQSSRIVLDRGQRGGPRLGGVGRDPPSRRRHGDVRGGGGSARARSRQAACRPRGAGLRCARRGCGPRRDAAGIHHLQLSHGLLGRRARGSALFQELVVIRKLEPRV